MVLLESSEVALGSTLPTFSLKDAFEKEYDSEKLVGKKGLLIVFTCNHCPYAQAVWPRVLRLANQFKELGINTVAINPNINPDYPEDSPHAMKQFITNWNVHIPYLVDRDQEVAKKFDAQCTPDIYLYNHGKKLVYHGRIDDNWRTESRVTSHELHAAMNALSNDLPINQKQKPSMGCSIKWV